jgi:hypothetical protein
MGAAVLGSGPTALLGKCPRFRCGTVDRVQLKGTSRSASSESVLPPRLQRESKLRAKPNQRICRLINVRGFDRSEGTHIGRIRRRQRQLKKQYCMRKFPCIFSIIGSSGCEAGFRPLTWSRVLPKTSGVVPQGTVILHHEMP